MTAVHQYCLLKPTGVGYTPLDTFLYAYSAASGFPPTTFTINDLAAAHTDYWYAGTTYNWPPVTYQDGGSGIEFASEADAPPTITEGEAAILRLRFRARGDSDGYGGMYFELGDAGIMNGVEVHLYFSSGPHITINRYESGGGSEVATGETVSSFVNYDEIRIDFDIQTGDVDMYVNDVWDHQVSITPNAVPTCTPSVSGLYRAAGTLCRVKEFSWELVAK